MTLPTDAKARKDVPLATGVLDYFPDALCAVAAVSLQGSRQHHPDKPLHWDRAKSTDEADALLRHFLERGKTDVDGHRHSAKVAWRALALLQKEIENDQAGLVTFNTARGEITADTRPARGAHGAGAAIDSTRAPHVGFSPPQNPAR